MSVPLFAPIGGPYSPIVDPKEITKRQDTLYPTKVVPTKGINFNDELHINLLSNEFIKYTKDIDYNFTDLNNDRYFFDNGMYESGDGHTTFCMLRHLKPKNIIEVGSGFSTKLMLDVNSRFFNNQIKIIEGK